MDEIEIVETITVVVSEELPPATATEELIQPRGSFASGEESMPEKDAAERGHPGTFADTEPQE